MRRSARRARRCRCSSPPSSPCSSPSSATGCCSARRRALRDGVLALVKIGIVLALATSWAAYRTLVYDVALKGPAELAAQIGQPAGLPGAGGGLVHRLGYTDRAFVAAGDSRHRRHPDRSSRGAPPGRRAGAAAAGRQLRRARAGRRANHVSRRRDRRPGGGAAGGRAAARAWALLYRLSAFRGDARAVRRLGARRSPPPRSARSAPRSCSASSWLCSSRGSPS